MPPADEHSRTSELDVVCCEDCGEVICPDPAGSVGVWVHDAGVLGDQAYDLNEDHAARPPEWALD